ncbi:sugar phosphate nucleotidyltransferase [Cohnella nanjingensis]|uniref:Mannose-1-phosphate guanylyltransferase n=1 Tax=Cohnella nanjingensis TaxID=1387779 RepID=A0A7X0RLT1_9BACL|nr:sugar phosphate nucleotidyltransferase [Cohnella nanjingensis]MBB6669858.1 mannose-1-phosphate guanylyltransferase [Cohnella nanjingensis]
MKIVLLSGGSGKRLWPLSTEQQSKQFLPLLTNESGQKWTMLQRTLSHLARLSLENDTVIATSGQYKDVIREQLNISCPCIAEPERRDTFPAIALSAAYLHSEMHVPRDEIVIVLPVDGGAEPAFYDRLPLLARAMHEAPDRNIGLIGARPDHPSDQYGYILPAAGTGSFLPVRDFSEKPDRLTAQRLIADGALWNCGVFAMRVGYLLDKLAERGYPARYEDLLASYAALPARSIDYEILERESHIGCLPFDGFWTDLGNWGSVARCMDKPFYGEGFMDVSSVDSHVINELPIPVIVNDTSGVIVIAGQEGILVSSKRGAPAIKPLLEGLKETAASREAPIRVHRQWIDSRSADTHGSQTNRLDLPKGAAADTLAASQVTVWTVIRGHGRVIQDDRIVPLDIGQTHTCLAPGRFVADQDAALIEVVIFRDAKRPAEELHA